VIAFALVPQVNWLSGKPCVRKSAGFPAPAPAPLCVTKNAGFPCPVLKKCAGSEPSRACVSVAPQCVTENAGFPATRRRLRQKYARVQSADRASGTWTPPSGHECASRSHWPPRHGHDRAAGHWTPEQKKRDGKTRRAVKVVGGLMLIDFPQPLRNRFFAVLEILRPSPTDGHNMLATTPQRRRETMH